MNSPCNRFRPATLRRRLGAILQDEPGSIRADVARAALDHADDPAVFFTDLARGGCASGMVSDLVYYVDTHDFFEQHYAEIERLREKVEAAHGEPLRIGGDLKNALAWFAFEETARRIACDELGLDL